MSAETKTTTLTENLSRLANESGIALMAAAAVIGMLELPTHPNNRIVLPNQPVLVQASEENELTNPIRREREEVGPHYISYAETQRTQARSGHR